MLRAISIRRVAAGLALLSLMAAGCPAPAPKSPARPEQRAAARPAAPPEPRADAAPPAPPDAAAERPGTRRVVWANIEATDGCFFFSGPLSRGRDDSYGGEARLEREGDALTLHFGDAAFEGSVDAYGDVELVRTTRRDHEGPWEITETLHGRMRGEQLELHYKYRECPLSGQEPNCPGRCRLEADAVLDGLPPTLPSSSGGRGEPR